MGLALLMVTTLLCVHAYAQSQNESSIVDPLNQNATTIQSITDEESTTPVVPVKIVSDATSRKTTQEEQSSMSTTEYIAVQTTTKAITQKANSSSTTEPPFIATSAMTSKSTANEVQNKTEETIRVTVPKSTTHLPTITDEETNFLPTKVDQSSLSTLTVLRHQTTSTKNEVLADKSTTVSVSKETTSSPSPDDFIKWLNDFHPDHANESNVAEVEKQNNQSVQNQESTDWRNKHNGHWNSMRPKEFMEWLDSIHPDSNGTATKNIIDTSIISTEKLIIVISTICGTFVLFVVILIAVSCCKRNRNIRNDSEKSDFSMTSVVSIPDKRKSDVISTDKNGFNNLFMGIPANNEVWKNLEQLSPAAPSVMPESTKM